MNSILQEMNSPTQVRNTSKQSRRLDLTGLRYGMLTVAGFDRVEKFISYWKVVCDCGGTKVVRLNSLRTGRTSSCGCLSKKKGVIHGYTNTKEHRTWQSIKTRCNNPNSISFKHYGGKGVKVCDRWLNSFQNFLTDMGNCPSPNHSIERRNSKGNYEPSNCYWATRKEQNNNTSQNRYIEYNGETRTLAQWCDLLGLKYDTVFNRLDFGDSVERAFRPTHKFNVGDNVWYHGDIYTISHKRTDNGHLTYRLDDGSIVHENRLA